MAWQARLLTGRELRGGPHHEAILFYACAAAPVDYQVLPFQCKVKVSYTNEVFREFPTFPRVRVRDDGHAPQAVSVSRRASR